MQSPEQRQLPVLPINSANRNKSLESNQPTEKKNLTLGNKTVAQPNKIIKPTKFQTLPHKKKKHIVTHMLHVRYVYTYMTGSFLGNLCH